MKDNHFLKEGDKVYCKKNWCNSLVKGETYEVQVKIIDNIYAGNDVGVVVSLTHFYFKKPFYNDTLTRLLFKEYFYTEKELRKKKLNEIEKR